MRILHVIPSVSSVHGGPSAVLRTMTSALALAGATVEVATTDDDGRGRRSIRLGQPIVEDGVTYRYFARQTHFYRASLPLARWLLRHTGDYDILHIHALFSFAAAPAALAAYRVGVPYVVRPLGVLNHWGRSQRRPKLKSASLRLVDGRILAHAAAIQWTSIMERDEGADLGLRAPGVVIPNPVSDPGQADSTAVPEYPKLGETTPVILFLGRIDPVKGVDLLLEAFAETLWSVPDSKLVVAGTGPPALLAQLRSDAVRLGIADAVVWPGPVYGPLKEALFRRATVFVLPSRSESFGVGAVEALARGKPVVVTDHVGVHQEIGDVGAGLVVSVDAAALAAGLLEYLQDDEAALEAGRRGRELVKALYAPDSVARQLVRMYEDIVNHRSPLPSYAAV